MTQPLLTEEELLELRRIVADRPAPPAPKPLHVVMVEVQRAKSRIADAERVVADLTQRAEQLSARRDGRVASLSGRRLNGHEQLHLASELGARAEQLRLVRDQIGDAERRLREARAALGELADDEARLVAAMDVAGPQHHAARVDLARRTYEAAEDAAKAVWSDVKRASTADDLEALAARLRAATGRQRWAHDRLGELDQSPATRRWWQR